MTYAEELRKLDALAIKLGFGDINHMVLELKGYQKALDDVLEILCHKDLMDSHLIEQVKKKIEELR